MTLTLVSKQRSYYSKVIHNAEVFVDRETDKQGKKYIPESIDTGVTLPLNPLPDDKF